MPKPLYETAATTQKASKPRISPLVVKMKKSNVMIPLDQNLKSISQPKRQKTIDIMITWM